MAMNLAQYYSRKVDERFSADSYAQRITGNSYTFDGVDTVNVYSVPTAPMFDYNRHGAAGVNRYGTPMDLQASLQRMTISRDRSFVFTIDRADLLQSGQTMEANKALSRQISEVIIPEYDSYVFQTLASRASMMGNLSTTTPSKNNAYSLFLKGQEFLGDHMVPDTGRVAVCSYAYANLLRQDPSFMRYGNSSQAMLSKGIIGEVDGVRIMRVPSSRLPNGCSCILTHPYVSVAPKQLREYKIHNNPVGISGNVVEGRVIYDCFVLDNKINGIYYIGGSGVLRVINVTAARAVTDGNFVLMAAPTPDTGNSWYFRTGEAVSTVTYGQTMPGSGWSRLGSSGTEITPTGGDTIVEVVEVDSDSKCVGHGYALLKD